MTSTKPKQSRPRGLPSKYEFVAIVGEGSYAKVVKCLNKETSETVAIKMPKCWTTDNKSEVGNFVDFDVHSWKRYCIVKGAVSALYKKL